MSEDIVEQRQKLGALWVRVSKSGDKYLSGELEIPPGVTGKVRIIAFKNRNKVEKQPDYVILKSKELGEVVKNAKVTKPVVKKPVPKPVPEPEELETTEENEEETDI